MKAELERNGSIRIIAENYAEGFFLQHYFKFASEGIILDWTILDESIPNCYTPIRSELDDNNPPYDEEKEKQANKILSEQGLNPHLDTKYL